MKTLVALSKELIEQGVVAYIIGYAGKPDSPELRPFIARTVADAERLTFTEYAVNNLAVYLTRLAIPKEKKIGIVAKGCDVRSIINLIAENQIARERVFIIGVTCRGVAADPREENAEKTLAAKCIPCELKTPHVCDELVTMDSQPQLRASNTRAEQMARLREMGAAERFSFWQNEFSKCIRCYACRQVCPNCYCEQCVVDKTVPRWIESSSTHRANYAWNITRAFHQAGRCTGCGECDRVCPANIPLSLLNMQMGMVAMKEFQYKAGMNAEAPTLIGSYTMHDKEEFIK
jgi:succinate dehydrogenase/fumarate reductase-like Fe-S protein